MDKAETQGKNKHFGYLYMSLYEVDLAYILESVRQQLLMESSVRGKQILRTRQSTQGGAM